MRPKKFHWDFSISHLNFNGEVYHTAMWLLIVINVIKCV